MRLFKHKKMEAISGIVRDGAVVTLAGVLVASVSVLTFTHAGLLSDSAGSEMEQTAVAMRGEMAVAEPGGERSMSGSNVPEAERASTSSGGGAKAESGAEANDRKRPISSAWAAEVIQRATQAAAERYARRFDISLDLARDIHRIALDERIDPDIAFGLVRTESSFRPRVVSWAGAVGLTQLLPSTANWIVPGTHRSELFNTEINLRVGFRYLRHLMDKYNGNERLALLAYNRGPGTVDGILRRGGDPSNGYASKVMAD